MRYDNPNHSYHYKYQLAVTRITTVLITLTLFLGLYIPWLIDLRAPFFIKSTFALASFIVIHLSVFLVFHLKKLISVAVDNAPLACYAVVAYLNGE